MNVQEIYERQCSCVYRVAMLYMKNTSDAEDIVQSVFLKYMEKPQIFQDEEHEKAWFITVSKNQCRDMLRNTWRRKVDLGEIPEQIEEGKEGESILPSLMKLQSKYREVLYLYYYEEYSIREMSEILKRKESTIQTQLAAARKKLRNLLERREETLYDRERTNSKGFSRSQSQ